jgi:hypothetical protein
MPIKYKGQERDALDQIKKILEELGNDSYVATAFKGCVEDAERNIENDFAFSMKDRYESESKRNCELVEQITKLNRKNSDLEDTVKQLTRQIDIIQATNEEAYNKLSAEYDRVWNSVEEANERREDAERLEKLYEQEVYKLKAKLYDLLVK